jgi:hypothetical protein
MKHILTREEERGEKLWRVDEKLDLWELIQYHQKHSTTTPQN